MHRGVHQLIRWVEAHADLPAVSVNAPAPSSTIQTLEGQLGVPLPVDLRLVLQRFNGGELPSGTLLQAGTGPGTIEDALRRFAEQMEADFLDPELPLPFHRTHEDSWLCFDRSAGPVSDTWAIVDYYDDTGESRLVYRTFDGWCRVCVSDWESPEFSAEFSLDKYLQSGLRHAAAEPDVSAAHATVAHALRRTGDPEAAMQSYLYAARCVPALPWCDWEALKLAVLLNHPAAALEAATRLCARAPRKRWRERETEPGLVADVLGQMAVRIPDASAWLRLLDQLEEQATDEEERTQVHAVRQAVGGGHPLPPPRPPRDQPAVPAQADPATWWSALEAAYLAGSLREEDLLLDPTLDAVRSQYDVSALLRIRREF